MKENLQLKLNIFDIVLNRMIPVIGLIILPIQLSAQVIDFSSYESSSTVVTTERNLEFGTVFKNDSETINLGSGLDGVISIVGIRFLDVLVDFSPFPANYLYLDGNTSCTTDDCRIPFSMSVSYTNAGQILDNVSGAVSISGASERFPIRARGGGPPRPPPVPPHSGYTPPTDTAYLYFYGSITTSFSNDSGDYWNVITVTVTYD